MQNSPELLRRLLDAGFEFVVVGGVAAIAHGSASFTVDFDVVASLTVENCRLLPKALDGLEPRFYQTPGRPPLRSSSGPFASG